MVSALSLVAAAAMAQAAPAADAVPACSLVTPAGQAIGFVIGGDDTPGHVQISATSGSAWPAATLRAAPTRTGSGLSFVLGAARRGMTLELGSPPAGQTQRSATLFLRENQRATLPVAYGFCEDRTVDATASPPPADAGTAGADDPAFAPASWPEDCRLILSDGRRLVFDFTMTGPEQVVLEGELWSGGRVSVRNRWTGSGAMVGSFGGPGGPEGVQMMIVNAPRAAKLIRFRQLGDPSRPNLTGYGICGYRQVVGRPNR